MQRHNPSEFNPTVVWVLDTDGRQYANWPVDVSDHADFMQNSYDFGLTEGVEAECLVTVGEEFTA